MGVVLFIVFMYAGHNAAKAKKLQEEEWDKQDAEREEIHKQYYENRCQKR